MAKEKDGFNPLHWKDNLGGCVFGGCGGCDGSYLFLVCFDGGYFHIIRSKLG